jgi:hypothetical protein
MRSEEEILADYKQYRGLCKELSESAAQADPSLTLVRGYYICEEFGKQPHWWTVKPDGSIFDPSCLQFPSGGTGTYIPFTGDFTCCICGKNVAEADVYSCELGGKDPLCSSECYGQYIGWE